MTSRIGTYASTNFNVSQLLQLHQSLDNLSTQLTTGKKSQDYAGISQVSGLLINFDNQHNSINNYKTSNTLLNTTLSTMSTAYSSIQTTVQQFKQTLENFIGTSKNSPADIKSLQQTAFQSLKNMEYYLNTQAGGKYVFSGSETDTPPVSINASTLSQFQGTYDGYKVVYPTTRDGNVNAVATTVEDTGSLTFDAAKGTITAANKGQFANVAVGANITLSGSQAYDGTYTVLANDGTSLTVSHNLVNEGAVINEAAPATATLSDGADTYANGATGTLTFNAANNTITAATANALGGVKIGDVIQVAGTAGNNGTYTVASTNGTTIQLATPQLTITRPDGTSLTTAASFSQPDTLNAQSAGSFTNLRAGDSFSVSGASDPANNGNFFVASNDGTHLVIERADFTSKANLATTAADATAVITSDRTTFGNTGTVNTGTLAFANPSTITAANAGSLTGVPVGSIISVAGAAAGGNNGSYRVIANNGTTLTVQAAQKTSLTPQGAAAAATITDGTKTLTNANTGNLNFYSGSSIITASTAGSLSGLKNGDTITLGGTALNNGDLKVIGTYKDSIKAETTTTVATEAVSAGSLTVGGDTPVSLTTPMAFTAGAPPTITTATANDFANLKAGDVIDVAGDLGGNDGHYVVAANNGSGTLTLASAQMVVNGSPAPYLQSALTFTPSGVAPTVSGSTADLGGLKAGDVVNLSGTKSNNGAFVVTNVTTVGAVTTVTFAPPNTAVQVATDIGLSTSSYYQGNAATTSQQIDTNNGLDYGVTAIDPAFEKALRAMALIAQGDPNTVGGLGMNMSRLKNADYLITSALDNSAAGASPFGAEQSSNIKGLQNTLAQQQMTLSNVNAQQTTYLGFIDTVRGTMNNADQTETVTALLSQQTALQASYQTMATVRQMSLLTYLK